jgi:CheY-like chemotaxis protein
VIERLKLSKKTGSIPIIVVIGSVDPDTRERVLGLGADAFFPKPPDLDELVATLARLTNTPARETESPAAPKTARPLQVSMERMEYHGA